jgi:hypothetical protein
VRYSGHGHPVASFLLKPHPWGCTDWVRYVSTTGREVPLKYIEGSHLPTSTQEIGRYRRYRFGYFDNVATKVLGKQGFGQVVLGGAKASGN